MENKLIVANHKMNMDAKEVNERLLKQGNAKGMSTFMGYYILSAMALAGNYERCLSCIREYWGGMLKLGATTFWETLKGEADFGGAGSLCHGWSAMAAYYYSILL